MIRIFKAIAAASADLLSHFGVHIEQAPEVSLPPGMTVEKVASLGAIGGVFARDAARQKAQSWYFNDGTRPRVIIENNTRSLQ